MRGYSATEQQPLAQQSTNTVLLASTSGKAYPGSVTIRLEADRREAKAGDELGFTITVRNHSDAIAGGLNIETQFDTADFTVLTADKAVLNGGSIKWINGGLRPFESKTLRFTVKLNESLTHGHVIRTKATLSGQALSGPVSATTDTGIIGSLPAAGGTRLRPLY